MVHVRISTTFHAYLAELKEKVLLKFRPTSAGTLHEQWLATTQTTTVTEYVNAFMEFASPLNDIPESIMRGQFMNGLKEEIKSEIRVLNPCTLDDTMDLAVRVEERNRVQGLKRTGGGTNRSGQFSYFSKSPVPTSLNSNPLTTQTHGLTSNHYNPVAKPTQTKPTLSAQDSTSHNYPATKQNTSRSTGETRRLTERELQEKRAKGLCFRCDERWGVGHRCQRKELSVLLGGRGRRGVRGGVRRTTPR